MEREELLQRYKEEKDLNIKDRLMLDIRTKFDGVSITPAVCFLGNVTS